MSDRTSEFFSLADAICRRRSRPPQPKPKPPKTPWGEHAIRLGRALHRTEGRTSRLAKLACKSSLFDDPATEIADISVAVRQELGHIVSILDTVSPKAIRGGPQASAHAEAVSVWLRTQMASVTHDFEAALRQREATISAKEGRAAKLSCAPSPFVAAAVGSPAAPGAGRGGGAPSGISTARPDFASAAATAATASRAGGFGGGGRVVAKPQLLQRRRPVGGTQRAYHDLGAVGFGGPQRDPFDGPFDEPANESTTADQLKQFWTPRSQQHREQEVSQMQSTLAELGILFQRFGAVVAEQGELVDRIDNNVEAANAHVEDAHDQIRKYQKTTSGTRALMLKIFGVLAFIIVIYGSIKS